MNDHLGKDKTTGSGDWSTEGPREDCNSRCKGYDGSQPCCGGCPVQCYCAMEQDNDAIASREEIYYPDYNPDVSDYEDGSY